MLKSPSLRTFPAYEEGELMKLLPSGNYFIDCRYRGIRIRQTAGPSKRGAERLLARIKTEIDNGDYQKSITTFEEAKEILLTKDILNFGKSAERTARANIGSHIEPYFKGMTIGKMIDFDSQGYCETSKFLESKSKLPISSFSKIKVTLCRIIRTTVKDFDFPKQGKPGYVVCRNEGFKQTRFLSEPEMLSIVELLSKKYKPIAIIMAYTGIDASEAIELKWSQVKGDMLVFSRGKTSVFGKIPMPLKAQGVIKQAWRVRVVGVDRVFPKHKYEGLKSAWKKARKLTGFEWARLKDLRHFYGSYLLNNGVDSLTVASLMRHKNPKMLCERYGHFSDKHLKKSVLVFG
jgi:integrase